MSSDLHITGNCIIRNGKVSRDGTMLFESRNTESAAFLPEIYRNFNMNYPKFHKMDSLCKLGFLASELLLGGRDHHTRYKSDGTGIVLYNAGSSIETDRNHQQSINDRSAYFPSPSVFVYTLANIVIGEICIRNKFFGESAFFINRTFDFKQMVDYVTDLFSEGIMESCICGWLELEGNHYDAALYLIEKSNTGNNGIVIFDTENIGNIYSQAIYHG
jgi:hypothetical protein